MKQKHLFLLGILACTGTAAVAQSTVLLADTAFTTRIVNGNRVSQMSKPSGTNFGIGMNRAAGFKVADDFTVPAGQTWTVDTIIVYGYQTGSTTTSTFTEATLQLKQSSVTGTSVFGDTSTNRLSNSSFTGIYRTDTSLANANGMTRPIMQLKLVVNPAKVLTAGTYWAVWNTLGSVASGPWCPPKVQPGQVNPANQNAMQFIGGSWINVKDSSAAGQQMLGFNMIVKGKKSTAGITNAIVSENSLQVVPNPAHGEAAIKFNMLAPASATLKLYSSTGQLVRTITDSQLLSAGEQRVALNASDLTSGMYFCELSTADGRITMPFQVQH